MTEIFDGRAQARAEMELLAERVAQQVRRPGIVSYYFREDPGSVYYARYKQRWAAKAGIDFRLEEHSLAEPDAAVIISLQEEVSRLTHQGLMVQKPTKRSFNEFFASRGQKVPDYQRWWRTLVGLIPLRRDVDGLSPASQERLQAGLEVPCLPATVRAVLKTLAGKPWQQRKILLIGKSDLLGIPLFYYLVRQGCEVELVGKQELEELLARPEKLRTYGVIVSAAGVPGLIQGEMIASGAYLVDVGEPQADVDRESVMGKADFLTPVPGGVGPLTVVSLLENSCLLSELGR